MSSLRESSLYQLTSMRFRLFLREPEALFWIFIFPILLAVGLGIAFRNRPADVLQAGATSAQLTEALNSDKGLTAATMDQAEGTHELATGRILLLAIQVAELRTSTTTRIRMRDWRGCLRIARFKRLRDRRRRGSPRTIWCTRRVRVISTLLCRACLE